MRSKLLSIALSSLVAVLAAYAIDRTGCALRTCVEDDAAMRATTLFAIPMLLVYAVATWLTVFPLIINLGKRVPKLAAASLVSLSFGFAVALLLHRPTIDHSVVHTLVLLFPWLVIPWFLGGWLATALWPYPPIEGKQSAPQPEA